MKFSDQIKQSGTDEWYTKEDDVDLIVPYLLRGGTKRFYAPSIKKKVAL